MLQFDKEHQFVDGIFLLKLTTPIHPSLIAMTKNVKNLSEDIKAFEFCTPTSESKYKNECTFVFNNDDIFYYTLYFHQNSETYELVIKSYQHCAHFFLNFLKQLYEVFCDVKSAYEPTNFFDLAKILITDWPTTLENSMKIVYPTNMRQVEFTNADFSYHHFNASKFFPYKLYSRIFMHLISLKPILFKCSDAVTGCKACFSAFSLLHPLRYSDPLILWLRKDDPRYNEILKSEEKSPYLVVATDDATEIESKFDLVITCSETFEKNSKDDDGFEKFTQRIFLMIQGEFVNLSNKNPYSDVLNLSWTGKNMEDIVQNPKFNFMPSLEILKIFESSKTILNWRKRRTNPEKIRETFLQCDKFDFESLDKDQLETIYNYLKNIINSFEEDLHVKLVIKKHMLIVAGILAKLPSEKAK